MNKIHTGSGWEVIYNIKAVDSTVLTALSAIALEQAKPTKQQCIMQNNFWIMLPQKAKPQLHTNEETWSWLSTVMPPI